MSTEFINDVLTVKGFTVGGIFLFVMFLLYLLRKLVSFRTECWFCSQKVFVNIFKRNSFTCPHCEQYNGFTEDGDYNKPIPAMYHSQLNQRRIHTEVVGHPPVYHNFLCDDCQANQINKIQQLTAFVPLNEANFEAEFSDFNRELEDIFELCTPCLLTVNRETERQDRILAPRLMAHRLDQKRKDKRRWIQPRAWGFIFVITFVRFAAVFATYSLFHTDMRIHNDQINKSHILWLSVYEQRHSVALAGLSLFILSTLLSGRDSLRRIDGLLLAVMSLLFLLSLPMESAVSIVPRKELENHNYRYLLSALSLLISVFWAISHLIGLIKSRKRNRSLPTPQPVQDEIDGFYGPSSEEEQVDEEGEEEEEEEEDVSTTIPSGERTAGTNRDIPGPSNSSRGPVRGGMGSLNLGPPGNLPKKRKEKQRNRRKEDKDEESTSGIDGSSDELSSSVSRRRTRMGSRDDRKGKYTKRRYSGASQFKSLLVAILFGISVGLNLSAALYLSSTKS
ncbi:uncharacterized protein [Apostichopus japonicus]|uniref:uncharacterized protein isoform X2 n=1 Tax=Stichopus japonicus TaxID=307972 RepID=UPI003AB5BE61